MVDNELIITDVHDEAAVAELRDRIIAFNIAVTGYDDGRSLSCFLRHDDGEMYAGLDGFTWGGYAMIEWLWSRRGRGTDSADRLVLAAENAGRGASAVVRVNTHTFQAPDFYRTLGYSEIGTAEDAPVGHGEVFFAKRLIP